MNANNNLLNKAERLVKDGDYVSAITLLEDNGDYDDVALAQRLIELRIQAYDKINWPQPHPEWPPQHDNRFESVKGFPEVDFKDLTAEDLKAGILGKGGLIVRGLMSSEDTQARMRDNIDRTLKARMEFYHQKKGRHSDPWYRRSPVVEGGPSQFRGGERYTTIGSVWSADSPPLAFQLVNFYREIGIPQLLRGYFDEDPVLSVRKWVVRCAAPNNVASAGWHQDGRFLGEHIRQAGSLVDQNRLRFDFAHHKAMTEAELHQVEDLVNEQILRNTELATSVESFDQAKEMGAMALFGEKYADEVRVVAVPGFSLELCGGTHVGRTGDIGLFRITSESGVAAGVRRIEAQTGHGALRVIRATDATLQSAARALKTSPDRLEEAVQKLRTERRAAEKKVESLTAQLAAKAAGNLVDKAEEVGGVKVLATSIDGDLKKQADTFRDKLGSSVVLLAGKKGPKVMLVCAATKDLKKRVHAGNIIKELAPLIGGRGGGRPDMAQAGGDDASGVDAALAKGLELIHAALNA